MPSAPAPRRLIVVGTGLIGTSIARAVRRRWADVHVMGIDLPHVLEQQGPEGFDALQPAEAGIPDHDLAVLACPVDAMPAWMRRLAADAPDRPVTDVGGVKRFTGKAAAAAGLRQYVGGHPMAGAAQAGPGLASAALFEGRPWFIVRGAASLESAALVTRLALACGAIPVESTADAHDATVAAVSHLPQVVASLLMQTVSDACDDAALACAGNGLRDTTRLAGSSAELWRPLVAANADRLAPLLADLAARLHGASRTLDDAAAVTRLFDDATRARRRLERPL